MKTAEERTISPVAEEKDARAREAMSEFLGLCRKIPRGLENLVHVIAGPVAWSHVSEWAKDHEMDLGHGYLDLLSQIEEASELTVGDFTKMSLILLGEPNRIQNEHGHHALLWHLPDDSGVLEYETGNIEEDRPPEVAMAPLTASELWTIKGNIQTDPTPEPEGEVEEISILQHPPKGVTVH